MKWMDSTYIYYNFLLQYLQLTLLTVFGSSFWQYWYHVVKNETFPNQILNGETKFTPLHDAYK